MLELQALHLPDPCLVVMIGAAGSGKSTLAARLFAPDVILSSDALRVVVAGDAGDQRATRTAFAILHRQLGRRLAEGRTTVVDATSVTPFARRGLLARAAAQGVPAVAIVLDLDPAIVLARNAARVDRVVPEIVVRRHLAELARSLRPGALEAEGFVAVRVLSTPAEVDALSVVPA
ncbi:MAG TPA: AAA family ATPase [Candidatus Limnocylindria bacterium]|nr:AAA family ATPase [Candidatus Limnocylindria bacterium]